jgi:uncharacterized membrane protein YkoI
MRLGGRKMDSLIFKEHGMTLRTWLAAVAAGLLVAAAAPGEASAASQWRQGEVRELHEGEDHEHDDDHIKYDDLPAAVKEAFERDYPGAKVKSCEKETDDDAVVYEIKFKDKDGKKQKARYNDTGEKVADHDHDDHGDHKH